MLTYPWKLVEQYQIDFWVRMNRDPSQRYDKHPSVAVPVPLEGEAVPISCRTSQQRLRALR
jgi:hypothetical protein